ncbi:hypothetical protein [Kistimonas asteriae]|uniref:hypothetical protein n=1 Tax=Kistimonas asteriae TaxID=517724 RepID=UPI001BA57973|nr:hypothetical protein [Kistimonas asteriae]
MANIPLSEFLRRIKPHVNGCPEMAIADTLRVVLTEVCRQVPVWRDEPQTVYFPAGMSRNTLATPECAEVTDVLSVSINGTPLRELDIPGDHATGTPHCYQFINDELQVYPTPATDVELTVACSLGPSFTCMELPKQVHRALYEFVPWGVMAELQMIPNQKWSEPKTAMFNRNRFRQKLNDLKIAASTGGATVKAIRQRFV